MRIVSYGSALVLLALSSVGASQGSAARVTAFEWRHVGPGLERTVFEVSAGGEGWRTHIVAVRIDPARFHFRLRGRLREAGPGWTVDRAPAGALFAVNAGQFSGITPWGWLVMDGEEIRPPGTGPLSTAIAWDGAGRITWIAPEQIAMHRAMPGVVEAFQTYQTLLDARGHLPRPIREPGLGIDVGHRDARAAIGVTAEGQLVVALTRFYGLGPLSPPVPLGLTLAEMATVMRGVGCRRAVSLDGGLSAQLLLREDGHTKVRRGWRPVPLGLVAEPVAAEEDTSRPSRSPLSSAPALHATRSR